MRVHCSQLLLSTSPIHTASRSISTAIPLSCTHNWWGGAQVDEPALREGLPLKRERWDSYLDWAVQAFRLATVVAAPSTQIVTHLCYSEFADILQVGGPWPYQWTEGKSM